MQIYWFKTRVKKMRLSALGGITNLVSFCFGPEERKRYGIAYKSWLGEIQHYDSNDRNQSSDLL